MKKKFFEINDKNIQVINLQSDSDQESKGQNQVYFLERATPPSDQSENKISESLFYSSSQEGPIFENLMPIVQSKRSKLNLQIKNFLSQERTDRANRQKDNQQEEEKLGHAFQREKSQNSPDSKRKYDNIINIPLPDEFSSSDSEQRHSLPRKKPKLMAEIEQQLGKPTSQLVLKHNIEEKAQRKREYKKREYLIKKKYREMTKGKKKDSISNQVFNAIEQYFI